MQYKDKKGCIWSKVKYDIDEEWIWVVKVKDENGNKVYNWKPKRIKIKCLVLIVDWIIWEYNKLKGGRLKFLAILNMIQNSESTIEV